MENKKLVRAKELGDRISMPTRTVRKLAREGIIPSYRVTKKDYLFDADEVLAHIKKRYHT